MILDGVSYDPFGFDHVLLLLGLLFISLQLLDFFFDVAFQVIFFKDEHDSVHPYSEILCSFKIFIKIVFVCHLQGMRTSNGNIGSSTYQFEDCFWNLLQGDLRFDGKTLIFQLRSLVGMKCGKHEPPQGELGCIFFSPGFSDGTLKNMKPQFLPAKVTGQKQKIFGIEFYHHKKMCSPRVSWNNLLFQMI